MSRIDNNLFDDVNADGVSIAAVREARAREGEEARQKRAADMEEREKYISDTRANAVARTDDGDGRQF